MASTLTQYQVNRTWKFFSMTWTGVESLLRKINVGTPSRDYDWTIDKLKSD